MSITTSVLVMRPSHSRHCVVVTRVSHVDNEGRQTGVNLLGRSDDENGPVTVAERLQHLKRTVLRLPTAMANYYSAYLTMSQMAKLLSADLQTFLVSDTAEVPRSLKQCGRLLEAGVRTLRTRIACMSSLSSRFPSLSLWLPPSPGQDAGHEVDLSSGIPSSFLVTVFPLLTAELVGQWCTRHGISFLQYVLQGS
jgi:hypothetical protein